MPASLVTVLDVGTGEQENSTSDQKCAGPPPLTEERDQRAAAEGSDESEGGDGEGEEEEDELASELWEGDDGAAEADWAQGFANPSDEELCEDDDVDEGEEEEEEGDEDELTPAGREAVAESPPSDRSSGSHRSTAETEVATAGAAGSAGLTGPKARKVKRVGSGGSGRTKRTRAPQELWGGDVDEDGEMRTTTIKFSLTEDLRTTPELLCKSKDKVPLFKLTASGSYNCTRNAFRRAGFKQTKSNNFTVLWGMPLKLCELKELREFQRVNHFPGTYLLGRKDNMARVCNRFRRTFGPENFEYFPKTFVCPGDRAELLADEQECKAKAKKGDEPMWIVKPPAGCKGIGIRLVTDPSTQIKERAIVVVSRYIDRPCLINKTKFDLRLYVAVTSFSPLRVYLHEHGLARFCTVKYSSKTRKNRFRHLTNYSLNKNNPEFKKAEGDADDEGHKWSARAVWEHLQQRGVDTDAIKERIDDLIVKTLLAVETQISTNMQLAVPHRNNCFELFGFDVILDESYKPWLVEVNTALSLATDAPLDKKIKNQVVTELLNMLRIQCYDRKKLEERLERDKNSRLTGSKLASKKMTSVTDNARRRDVCAGKRNALEELTEEDVRILEEIEQEYARKGAYRRVFPQNNEQMHTWMQLFEVKRYNNILQYNWITRPEQEASMTPREYVEQQRSCVAGCSPSKKPTGQRGAKTRTLGPEVKSSFKSSLQRLAAPSHDRKHRSISGDGGGAMGSSASPGLDEIRGRDVLVSEFMEWMQKTGAPYNTMERAEALHSHAGSLQSNPHSSRSAPTNSGGRGLSGRSSRQVPASPSASPPLSPHVGRSRNFIQLLGSGGSRSNSPLAGNNTAMRSLAERRNGMGAQLAPQPSNPSLHGSAREREQNPINVHEVMRGAASAGSTQHDWTDFARYFSDALPGFGVKQQPRPLWPGHVEWMLARERGSVRPQSPIYGGARSHTHQQNGNATAMIGLQGLRLGGMRTGVERGGGGGGGLAGGGGIAGPAGQSIGNSGPSRCKNGSLGQAMSWHENVLKAVADAAVHHQRSDRAPPNDMSNSFFASPDAIRPHAPASGRRERNRSWPTSKHMGGEAESMALEASACVGVTSAPVASPRHVKGGSLEGGAAKLSVGPSVPKDVLLLQNSVGLKKIGLWQKGGEGGGTS